MTKKFLSFVLTIACSLLLGSCENSEGLIVEDSKLDMSLFSQTYTIDDEGCCVLKGAKPITRGEVQSKVLNYGWKSIATYEVLANGKLSKEEFWKDMVGGSPTHYWFESSQQLVQYFYMDAKPAFCFRNVSWSYDATKGFILCGNDKSATVDQYKQILKLVESDGCGEHCSCCHHEQSSKSIYLFHFLPFFFLPFITCILLPAGRFCHTDKCPRWSYRFSGPHTPGCSCSRSSSISRAWHRADCLP